MSTTYQRVPFNDYAPGFEMRVGGVEVIPAAMLDIFGPPDDFDEYKISGIYLFKADASDIMFAVYDYKATSLYDPEHALTPDQFWPQTRHARLNVGGGDGSDPRAFQNWLYQHVGPPPKPWWTRLMTGGKR